MNKLFQNTPDDWNIIKLKHAINLSSGKVRPKDYSLSKSKNYQYPIYGGNGILGYSESFLIDFETIIIGRVGEYCGSIHLSNSSSWISDNAMYVNKFLRNDLDKYFLANILELLKLNRFKKRAGQPLISQNIVYSQSIPIPPIKEQTKIVSILENVDKLIQITQRLIEIQQECKKGLMQRLFTEGIRHSEFKDSKWGQIPKEWDIKRLGEFMIFKNGINFNKDEKGASGILTVDVKNMYTASLGIKLCNLYRVKKSINESYILKEGDILFVRSSLKQEGVGWPNLFIPNNGEKISFCGFLIRGRVKKPFKIDPRFLVYFLRYPRTHNRLINYSGKVAITNVSQDSLKVLPVFLPCFEEQVDISSKIHHIEKIIEMEKKYKKKLNLVKKGLMQVLLTCKKRVPI